MSKLNNRFMRQHGFSLIEISIVLVIVGLLLGGMLSPLSSQVENARRSETRLSLKQALDAVYGYAMVNGRLPCPDTSGDGQENRTGNNCTSVRGALPWTTLAVDTEDAWGQAFIYRVTNNFADLVDGTGCGTPSTGVSVSFCSQGDIQILDSAGGNSIALNVPAVIISRGKNFGIATGNDEAENNDNDNIFVEKDYSSANGAEFDDLITWVVPGVLMTRLVDSGRLP